MSASERDAARATRREVLEGAVALGAAAGMAATFGGKAAAETAEGALAPAYRGQHPVLALPFDPAALAGLSAKLLVSHHDNNYAGAVKRLNAIQQQLGSLPDDAPPHLVGALKREELVAANSKRLHELYFANLGGGGSATGPAARLLKAEYGSLERWERDFRTAALALGGGSGWVIVAFDPTRRSLHNWSSGDHAQQVSGGEPVLVLDMYEHAYHIDYGAAVKPYLDAFLANVAWDEVNRRLEAASAPAPRA